MRKICAKKHMSWLTEYQARNLGYFIGLKRDICINEFKKALSILRIKRPTTKARVTILCNLFADVRAECMQ